MKEFDASLSNLSFVYYVLEGSKNGALQILPKLKEQLGEGEYKYFAVDENFRAEFMSNIQKRVGSYIGSVRTIFKTRVLAW